MKKEYTVRCFLNNKLSLRRKVSLFRNMTKNLLFFLKV